MYSRSYADEIGNIRYKGKRELHYSVKHGVGSGLVPAWKPPYLKMIWNIDPLFLYYWLNMTADGQNKRSFIYKA